MNYLLKFVLIVILVTLLSNLNIPTCAIRLIISYIRNWSMING